METPVEDRSSVTVVNLEGFPKDPQDLGETRVNPKKIRSPWIFGFEVSER